MLKPWKKQSLSEHLSMQHEDPNIFNRSQWQRDEECNIWYVALRWLVALFFVITWILSVIELDFLDASTSFRVKWLIYLTNWGYTVCTAQAILLVVMTTSSYCNRMKHKNVDTISLRIYKTYWATHIIATDLAFIITIIYWSILYSNSRGLDGMDLIVHGFNSILMFLDLWIVAHPVKPLHFYWPILFGTIYALFSLIYFFAGGTSREGGTAIYSILDWTKPGMSVTVVLGVLVLCIAIHFFTYGVCLLRLLLHSKLVRERKGDVANNTTTTGGYVNEGLSLENA